MKDLNLVGIVFLAMSFTFHVAPWREYQSYEGKFKVMTPAGVMTEKVKKIETDLGDMNYHQFINKPEEKDRENEFYIVNYCDYPAGSFPQDSTDLIEEFLKTTIESSASSVGGKVVYQSDIQQFMHKGKVWRVQYNNDQAQVKNKCFLVGDRFYMLQVMTLKKHSLNPLVDKFLDSFHIF